MDGISGFHYAPSFAARFLLPSNFLEDQIEQAGEIVAVGAVVGEAFGGSGSWCSVSRRVANFLRGAALQRAGFRAGSKTRRHTLRGAEGGRATGDVAGNVST